MNRAGLNTTVLNAGPLDAIQRAAVAMVAMAVAVVGARKMSFSTVLSTPAAQVALVGRALARSVENCEAKAYVVIGGLQRVFISVAMQAMAFIAATGAVFARAEVRSPVNAQGGAVIWGNAVVFRRQPQAYTGAAVADITGRLSYSLVRDTLPNVAQAVITIDFSTYKQWPYDEDATDDRTMLVSEDDRTMIVA